MSADTILGIDPGTRRCGIAVMHRRKLVHWQVQTFPGAWSDGKLKRILKAFAKHIDLHSVRRVAIKIPDVLPASIGFAQLIGSLNILMQSKRIRIRYYTLSELKHAHAGTDTCNAATLHRAIVNKHPELSPEYQREMRNEEKTYYSKIFQAVAAAKMRA